MLRVKIKEQFIQSIINYSKNARKTPPIDRRATVFQRLIQGAVSARIAPENLRHHLEQLSVKEREDLAIATGGQRGDGKAIEILIQYLRTDPY